MTRHLRFMPPDYDGPMSRWKLWLYPVLAIAVIALAWLGPLDRAAEDQAQAGLKRALATFAAARALNGVISVAQGTEVAVEPAGVGVTFTPGQVLDPVNDLIEQFSTLMLSASVSFGVQSALVAIGGHWLLSLLLSLAVAVALLWRQVRHVAAPALVHRALLLLLLLRFAVPLAALGSDAAFRWFLADRYQRSQAALTLSEAEVGTLAAAAAPAADSSVSARLQRWWDSAGDTFDVSKRLDALKAAATQVTENVVELIVVFLLQTLIVPTLLMWGLWRIALGLLTGGGDRSDVASGRVPAPLSSQRPD